MVSLPPFRGGHRKPLPQDAPERRAVFLTLKKQMEATAPLAPDGTLRVDASVPERAGYEQQIETLQDGKRTLYERYLMGEIDLNTYKAEKATCDELLLKTKNAYAAVLAQAKQKQDEQARQDSRSDSIPNFVETSNKV